MIVIMLFTISVYLWQNKYVVILPGIFNLISIWKWRINSMKKFGILQRIRFRDRMFIIYFIGGGNTIYIFKLLYKYTEQEYNAWAKPGNADRRVNDYEGQDKGINGYC